MIGKPTASSITHQIPQYRSAGAYKLLWVLEVLEVSIRDIGAVTKSNRQHQRDDDIDIINQMIPPVETIDIGNTSPAHFFLYKQAVYKHT